MYILAEKEVGLNMVNVQLKILTAFLNEHRRKGELT